MEKMPVEAGSAKYFREQTIAKISRHGACFPIGKCRSVFKQLSEGRKYWIDASYARTPRESYRPGTKGNQTC